MNKLIKKIDINSVGNMKGKRVSNALDKGSRPLKRCKKDYKEGKNYVIESGVLVARRQASNDKPTCAAAQRKTSP